MSYTRDLIIFSAVIPIKPERGFRLRDLVTSRNFVKDSVCFHNWWNNSLRESLGLPRAYVTWAINMQFSSSHSDRANFCRKDACRMRASNRSLFPKSVCSKLFTPVCFCEVWPCDNFLIIWRYFLISRNSVGCWVRGIHHHCVQNCGRGRFMNQTPGASGVLSFELFSSQRTQRFCWKPKSWVNEYSMNFGTAGLRQLYVEHFYIFF